jgi:hypothetical protein
VIVQKAAIGLVLLATVAWTGPTAGSAQVSFVARRDVLPGLVRSDSIALADFNGDGRVDLAVADNVIGVGPRVSVMLGNGDGSFQSPQHFIAGANPRSVMAADFNGDGIIDLVVTNFDLQSSNTVSVLLGVGDGTFQQPPMSYTVGLSPIFIAIADFNRDGVPDLAVADYRSDRVSVLLGIGDGTFQEGPTLEVGYYPVAIAVADFNADGFVDLAVANSQASSVSVLLGNGDGSFQDATTVSLDGAPVSVRAGDFNADGVPDLIISLTIDSATAIVELAGNGDGTFGFALRISPGAGVLALGDLNADGRVDVIAGEPQSLTVLLSNGDGTFQRQPDVRMPLFNTACIVTADVNGDGLLDVAAVASQGGGADLISVFLGNGDGTFQQAPTVAASVSGGSPAVADFNHDGLPDIVVANSTENTVTTLIGNGDGTFTTAGSFPAGVAPYHVVAGDFDRDGNLDVVVTSEQSGSSVMVLLGNGDGTFQAPAMVSVGGSVSGLVVGDLDGDGILDLAVSTRNTSDGAVVVLLGTGDGRFTVRTRFGLSNGAVALADFNHDNILDLALAASPDQISVWLGNGDGTFRPGGTTNTSGAPLGVAAGDLNGDNELDLMITEDGGAEVLFGRGDGTFEARVPVIPNVAYPFASPVIADFNGDGVPDMAAISYQGDTVVIVLGRSDGTFSDPLAFGADRGPLSLVAADVNLDGRPDLVVSNIYSNTLSMLMNTTNNMSVTAKTSGRAAPSLTALRRIRAVR